MHLVATHNTPRVSAKHAAGPGPKSSLGRMMTAKAVAHVANLQKSEVMPKSAILDRCSRRWRRKDGSICHTADSERPDSLHPIPARSSSIYRQTDRVVSSFAAQAAIAIENTRLLKRTARPNREDGETQSLLGAARRRPGWRNRAHEQAAAFPASECRDEIARAAQQQQSLAIGAGAIRRLEVPPAYSIETFCRTPSMSRSKRCSGRANGRALRTLILHCQSLEMTPPR
jgi:hypothetical protein